MLKKKNLAGYRICSYSGAYISIGAENRPLHPLEAKIEEQNKVIEDLHKSHKELLQRLTKLEKKV